MKFSHMGEIKNGVESESSWKGAMESYYLADKNGGTEVRAELDSVGSIRIISMLLFRKRCISKNSVPNNDEKG
jgi:hypothetical protein